MSNTPLASHQNLMVADPKDEQRPRAKAQAEPVDGAVDETIYDGETNEPLPTTGEDAEVGLAQKGTNEDAIVRRETEI